MSNWIMVGEYPIPTQVSLRHEQVVNFFTRALVEAMPSFSLGAFESAVDEMT